MGDGGDGDADLIAELPVDYGTETVLEAAGDPGGDDLPVIGGPALDGGSTARERGEDEVIEMTWTDPDATSGS
jgi:hypothetical protein